MGTQILLSGGGSTFKLEGTNYLSVLANGTPAENGQAVKDAYALAQTLTPNGNPLSAENRVTILLASGYYDFKEDIYGQFIISSKYIDFISLSGQPDVYFSSIDVISQTVAGFTTCDIRIVGIDTTKNSYYSHGAFGVESSAGPDENIIIKNCVGGDYSFSCFSSGFVGEYNNCTARNFSFCCVGDPSAPAGFYGLFANGNFANFGDIKNCKAEGYSFVVGMWGFSTYTIENYGTIENCEAIKDRSFVYSLYRAVNYGSIRNCRADLSSFLFVEDSVIGSGATINSGRIEGCRTSDNSFVVYSGGNAAIDSALNQGEIINCQSFGKFSSFVVNMIFGVGNNSGTVSNCISNATDSFCAAYGLNAGYILDCFSSDRSFCSYAPGNIYGDILRCTIVFGTWTTGTTGGGRVVLGIDSTGVVNF